MQVYSDPKREKEEHALPDVEVFFYTDYDHHAENPEDSLEPGYYFWYCFPGCLPDGEPFGPYETELAAKEAAQEETLAMLEN